MLANRVQKSQRWKFFEGRAYCFDGESGISCICTGMAPAAVICTTVATCSSTLILSRGDTVTSVLWVTNEVGDRGCTIRLLVREQIVDVSIVELQLESVREDFSVQPEKTDSEASLSALCIG